MTNYELKETLRGIIDQEENTIKRKVALEALCRNDSNLFFQELLQYGCNSGMIQSLISIHNTHSFFDTHHSQIEELREEFENENNKQILIKGDLKTTMAWFAFEQTALNMAEELGLFL